MDNDNIYLTQKEVAHRFRVSEPTIKNWRDKGLLEFFQSPGSSRIVYPKEALEEFERRCTKKATVIESKKPAEMKRKMPEVSSKREWRI